MGTKKRANEPTNNDTITLHPKVQGKGGKKGRRNEGIGSAGKKEGEGNIRVGKWWKKGSAIKLQCARR